ncbi:MAG: flagellin [Brevundimonas sp.]|uniref:flagellin n=1 Tax=Brevundimonas sp. TaxID=1871086 RepID=UPI000DB57DD2|nr:flagellin [Brevundimonas sp.]PZU74557.1 MAG: flagellin [Brevundimonas sp.]
MANSINTNYGAAIALQNLNKTNASLETTQNRINTGMKVSSAKDNGAIFAIATTQRANMGAMDAVKNSLQRGQSIVDVALAAGDTATSALEEMKALAVNIASSTGDAQTAYLADYTVTNLTTNTSGGTYAIGFAAAPSADATLTAVNTGAITAANATVTNVDAAIKTVTTSLATLGTQSKSVGRQLTFVGKLQDATEAGIGNLVDADLAKESARLTALQSDPPWAVASWP